MSSFVSRAVLCLLLLVVITACGQKGALKLPKETAEPPETESVENNPE